MANIGIDVILSAKDNASATLSKFGGELSGLRGTVDKFTGNLQTAGLAFAGLGAVSTVAAKSFVDAASFMEQAEVAFNTLTGSAKTGKKTLEDLINFAKTTPFEIPQILEQSKRLLAMGTSAQDLIPTFKMLGDVAAGVGMEKLPQLVLAFGQIQAKGRLMGTELRQLTEAGFNLADAMGISNAKLEEMVSNGEVGFTDVANAFRNVTEEGGRFHNLMQQQALTTGGQLSNLSDNMFKLKATIGEALLPAVNQLIVAVTPLIQQFADWATKHQELIVALTAGAIIIGLVGSAILILIPIVTGLIATFNTLTLGIGLFIKIITAMVALLGGPLTVIILAIIAIGTLLYMAWKNNWLGIRDIVSGVVDWFMHNALPVIQKVGGLIMDIVKAVADVWVQRFNLMKSVVEGVINAIRGIISAAESLASRVKGGLKIPGFQSGGIVPGPVGAPQLAMVHGGEEVIPTNRTGRGGGGGGGVSFNVTIGMYAGSETEKRNVAQELYLALVQVAQAQNLTVRDMLGA